jgi:hypothetical protein
VPKGAQTSQKVAKSGQKVAPNEPQRASENDHFGGPRKGSKKCQKTTPKGPQNRARNGTNPLSDSSVGIPGGWGGVNLRVSGALGLPRRPQGWGGVDLEPPPLEAGGGLSPGGSPEVDLGAPGARKVTFWGSLWGSVWGSKSDVFWLPQKLRKGAQTSPERRGGSRTIS